MTSNSPGTSSEPAGGTRVFSGENADHKEYRRWKLWVSNKLRTLDKLQKENYGSYIFTCLSGKALECVEHLEPSQYQCEGGDEVLWNLLDKRFPEKEKTDQLAEILGEVFSLRAKEGEALRTWVSRGTELFERCERKTGVKFPTEARGWMILRWSGLSEEQQAVVKGRAMGDMTLEVVSKAMRSVYPDFICRRRTGAAMVEEVDGMEEALPSPSDEVQGFDDIELFLTDYVPEDVSDETYPEQEVAEVLATTWRERRTEISKLQKQRRFSDARDLKKSFRVEIEELKKKTKCNRCGATGHWARECRQKRDFNQKSGNPSAQSSTKPTGAGMVIASTPELADEAHFIASVSAHVTLLDQLRQRSLDAAEPTEVLLVSSPGYGVLDSGCGKTIIGEVTLNKFMDLWKSADVQLPVTKPEMNCFRFGNGQMETSQSVVHLPIGLAGKRGMIQAAVVKGDAPLLVSRPALKRLGAAIDFSRDQLSLFQDKTQVPLKVNSAGQYVVDVMQFPAVPCPAPLGAQVTVPAVVSHSEISPPSHDAFVPDAAETGAPMQLEKPHHSLM